VTGSPYVSRYKRPGIVYGYLTKGRTAEELAEFNKCHAEAVESEASKWLLNGWTVTANVSIKNALAIDVRQRRAVADLVAVSPDGQFIRVLEIKTGQAGYSPNQAMVYSYVGQPMALYAVGAKAASAGLQGALPWIGIAMAGHRYGDGKSAPCSQMIGTLPPPTY
jgi:hypothetical protein